MESVIIGLNTMNLITNPHGTRFRISFRFPRPIYKYSGIQVKIT